jgi:hypothetical protein
MATTSLLPADHPQEVLDEAWQAARLRFTGMSVDELGIAYQIDDRGFFIVEAVCTGQGIQRMKDGELRRTLTMEVLGVEAKGDPIKPSDGPNLFTVDD